MAAKSLVYNIVRRKIGKGDTVSVWIEPWLPDESNPFVESQASTGLELITMNDLKSVDGQHWDYDLFDDLFNERDKQLILQKKIELSGHRGWMIVDDRPKSLLLC